jgi:hypothetical protein
MDEGGRREEGVKRRRKEEGGKMEKGKERREKRKDIQGVRKLSDPLLSGTFHHNFC